MVSPPLPRILLCGDVAGRINHLVKRINSLNQSTGPFDAVFCVGEFLSHEDEDQEIADYLGGEAAFPIPTYFIGSARRLSARPAPAVGAVELCPNLYWLKGSGKLTLHGLSVVYLSGTKDGDLGYGTGKYNQDDIDALRAIAEEPGIVDLLLTNEWPAAVVNGVDTTCTGPQAFDPVGSDPRLSDLAADIKPRYHIAGSKGIFFARDPYANAGAMHVTRFIGLGAVGNKAKEKYIHAISPTPASTMSIMELSARPPNTTLSPYRDLVKVSIASESSKRNAESNSDAQYWRFDTSQKRRRQEVKGENLCFTFTSSGSCPNGSSCQYKHDEAAWEYFSRNVCFDFLNKGKCERGPDCKFLHSLSEGENNTSKNVRLGRIGTRSSCWFCLSSPDVESHLIVSVGDSFYCALAKGPLVENHVLLVPIEHCSSTLTMPLDAEKELASYKDALNLYFEKQKKAVVYFELFSPHSHHTNLQAVPIPASKAASVKKIFNLAAKRLGFEFTAVNAGTDAIKGRSLLRSEFDGERRQFYVETPEGTIYHHHIEEEEEFPAQFGREVLAGLLSMADRSNWRDCTSKEEEVQMVERFKRGFQDFDPAR